jgi:hypothetical protein
MSLGIGVKIKCRVNFVDCLVIVCKLETGGQGKIINPIQIVTLRRLNKTAKELG